MRGKFWKVLCHTTFALLLYPGTARAKEVDWRAFNPELADATYIGSSEKCLECHEDYMATYKHTIHAKAAFKMKENDCEACHGPMSKHLDAPKRRPPITVSFKKEWGLTPEQKNSICLQCHENGQRMYWRSGLHQASGVSCDSCHYVMERRSDKSLLINEDVKTACYKCHQDKRAQSLKASHMPVREGKMDCNSCHNPHGSPAPKMLKANSINDMCYSCHAEKRGPFLWEHVVVRENCSNCHDPHGSNNPKLLNTKGSFLCLQCHQYGGHVNMPRYNRASNPYGQGCVNCHNRIHGSNHPSGAKFTR